MGTLNDEQLEQFIEELKRDEYVQQSQETELTNIEKRRLASADANRRRRESEARPPAGAGIYPYGYASSAAF